MAASGARTRSGAGSTDALGDIVLMPLMLNYNVNPDFNVNFRLNVYAPTGSYEVGRLANTGKNFWTVEPIVGFMYFGQKNGREATVFIGADFNTRTRTRTTSRARNSTSTARSPSTSRWWAASSGGGVSGYYYQQVTGTAAPAPPSATSRAGRIGARPGRRRTSARSAATTRFSSSSGSTNSNAEPTAGRHRLAQGRLQILTAQPGFRKVSDEEGSVNKHKIFLAMEAFP